MCAFYSEAEAAKLSSVVMSADVIQATSLPLQATFDKPRDSCCKVTKKHKHKRSADSCEDKHKRNRSADCCEDNSLLSEELCDSVLDSGRVKGQKTGRKSRKRKLKRRAETSNSVHNDLCNAVDTVISSDSAVK